MPLQFKARSASAQPLRSWQLCSAEWSHRSHRRHAQPHMRVRVLLTQAKQAPTSNDARLRDLLSDGERQRCARFRRADDVRRFVAGRLLVRHWIDRTGFGRRYVKSEGNAKPTIDGIELDWNISHDGRLVALAVATDMGVRVGVDVFDLDEFVQPGQSVKELLCGLSHAFSDAELSSIHGAPNLCSALERLAQLWTVKESYAKAVGLGLALEPQRLAVSETHTQRPHVSLDGVQLQGWYFSLLSPLPGCWLCVAASADVQVEVEWIAPLI